ncbi:MAG: hypothetical protein K2X31_03925 [Sphingopyxis sp.]|nr:hypothetical protein [Sphingopyxis sp.]
MSDSIKQLIERARTVQMNPQTQEAQRQSFAYGNANIENARITKAMVEAAAGSVSRKA